MIPHNNAVYLTMISECRHIKSVYEFLKRNDLIPSDLMSIELNQLLAFLSVPATLASIIDSKNIYFENVFFIGRSYAVLSERADFSSQSVLSFRTAAGL